MFAVHDFKNARRGVKRQERPTDAELLADAPFERSLPYFSIVWESALHDAGYAELPANVQGTWWRLVVHVLWPGAGRCVRSAAAAMLKLPPAEWEAAEAAFIGAGLLVLSADGVYLVSVELRRQYRMTATINERKGGATRQHPLDTAGDIHI